jgi:ribonuclease Y
VAGWFLTRRLVRRQLETSREEAETIRRRARRRADEEQRKILLQARKEAQARREEAEQEAGRRQTDMDERESRLAEGEERLEAGKARRHQERVQLEARERNLAKAEKSLARLQAEAEQAREDLSSRLETVAGLSREEAKKALMTSMRGEARYDAARMIKEIKDEAREQADLEATKIISLAIERSASEVTGVRTASAVPIPSEKIKGRLIGHEGKNIRAFEKSTGMQLIVDESPDLVVLSGFNPIKREIARLSLEKLIKEGNIHPRRIEEVVDEHRRWMIKHIQKVGEETCRKLKIRDVHPEILRLLGRLKYRTSYGQNVLEHSIEVAHITSMMAAELGLDEKLALRAGLFHDIGKAIDYEREGTHPEIGEEVGRKYNEPEIVVNAIASHHEDVEVISPISVLVSAADAISGSRPGARRKSLTDYVKRIEKLETLANGTDGVERSYAIQAGREIRVIARHAEVDDAQSEMLASMIAQRIQAEMEYPGKIKVTVIREMRATDYAR